MLLTVSDAPALMVKALKELVPATVRRFVPGPVIVVVHRRIR